MQVCCACSLCHLRSGTAHKTMYAAYGTYHTGDTLSSSANTFQGVGDSSGTCSTHHVAPAILDLSPIHILSTHCVLQNAGIACGPYSLTLSDGQQLTVDLAFACMGSIPQCPTGLPVSSHGVLVLPTLQVCPDCLMLACNILLASAKVSAADRVPCILSEGHRPACMAVSNKGRDGEMNQS